MPRPARRLWKFYNTPAPGEPGGDSWGNVPLEGRIASSWGLPGSYDPVRKVLYWAISNPKPWTRWKRHGDINAVPRSAPSELYSNSTVALDVETGKLVWYYQHLPGDDWDLDHIHERTLVRTAINPDPAAVKWINPNITRGEVRDVVVEVGGGRRHLGARPRDRAVPLGHALPARRSRLPYLRTSTSIPAAPT